MNKSNENFVFQMGINMFYLNIIVWKFTFWYLSNEQTEKFPNFNKYVQPNKNKTSKYNYVFQRIISVIY